MQEGGFVSDFTITISGIDKAIKDLEAYKVSLVAKKREFMTKLAEIGIETATLKFSTAQYDGDNDVIVQKTPEWIDENTLEIVASGTTVLFIEFGAGVHYTEQHPKADELGFTRGTYGQGKGSRDMWGYYGSAGTNGIVRTKADGSYVVLTHGNPPARAMYDASKEMESKILEIAKEVYGNG